MSPIGPEFDRLIVVRSAEWASTTGRLSLFERTDGGWAAVAPPMAVVLGRSGLGWGRGAHDRDAVRSENEPVKAEGDGRAPAGVFALGAVFGYDAAPPIALEAPYQQATESWQCVDDTASPRYNRVVDTSLEPRSWSSFEALRREDDLYRLLVVVEHNTAMPVAGEGSCIFLHVWRGPDRPTAGCTAITHAELQQVAAFIRPGRTLLVQLPDEVYARLKAEWMLP